MSPLTKRSAAERSHPVSEVRGSGREELSHIRGQGWQPRVLGYDSAGAAERSYPTSEARGVGWEELLCLRPVAAAGRSYPKSKEWRLRRHRRA